MLLPFPRAGLGIMPRRPRPRRARAFAASHLQCGFKKSGLGAPTGREPLPLSLVSVVSMQPEEVCSRGIAISSMTVARLTLFWLVLDAQRRSVVLKFSHSQHIPQYNDVTKIVDQRIHEPEVCNDKSRPRALCCLS
jgi:hypothetical protein